MHGIFSKSVGPSFQVYPEGRMSQLMDHLKIGEKLQFKGPRGDFALDLNEKRGIGNGLLT